MAKIDGLKEDGLFEKSPVLNILISNHNDLKYPPHWHNALELAYSCNGSHRILVNGHEYELKEKDLLMIAAGDIHSIAPFEMDGKKIFIQIHNQTLDRLIELGLAKSQIYQTRYYSFENHDMRFILEEHIVKLTNTFLKDGEESKIFQLARLCDILSILSQSLTTAIQTESTVESKRIYGLKKINSAFRFIEENFHKNITLKDVSDAVGFSENYFSKIFKEIYGKNFNNFLKEFRIKNAEKLMFENMSITEAALASGFNSIVTFNRVFKELKGCTPSEYIKMHTGMF